MSQELTPEQMAEVEKATLKNIVDKVRSGGVPTKREFGMLYEAAEEPASSTGIPERMNGADLAHFCGMKQRTFTTILSENGIAGDKRNGYDLRECIPVVIDSLVRRNKKSSEELEQDKALTVRAERESAQLDAAAKKGSLVPVESFEMLVDDFQIQTVDLIKRTEMSGKTRDLLIAGMKKIDVRPPKDDQ